MLILFKKLKHKYKKLQFKLKLKNLFLFRNLNFKRKMNKSIMSQNKLNRQPTMKKQGQNNKCKLNNSPSMTKNTIMIQLITVKRKLKSHKFVFLLLETLIKLMMIRVLLKSMLKKEFQVDLVFIKNTLYLIKKAVNMMAINKSPKM